MNNEIIIPSSRKSHNGIVPYDVKKNLRKTEWSLLHPDLLHEKGTTVKAVPESVLVATMLAFMTSVSIHIMSGMLGYETVASGTFMFACMIPLFSVLGLPFMASYRLDTKDRAVITDALRRVRSLMQPFSATDRENYDSCFVMIREENVVDGDSMRHVLFRMDAVAISLESALEEIGQHKAAREKATQMAWQSICRIMENHEHEMERVNDGTDVMERLENSLARAVAEPIEGMKEIAPTAPTARIARIVDTAERALQTHPDLVDAQGARVDALVRTHVPRLLRKHTEAARTAPTQDIDAVDAALDQAIDAVRASVEEAVSALHDIAMDELATELRFLSLRRGTTPALKALEKD